MWPKLCGYLHTLIHDTSLREKKFFMTWGNGEGEIYKEFPSRSYGDKYLLKQNLRKGFSLIVLRSLCVYVCV